MEHIASRGAEIATLDPNNGYVYVHKDCKDVYLDEQKVRFVRTVTIVDRNVPPSHRQGTESVTEHQEERMFYIPLHAVIEIQVLP